MYITLFRLFSPVTFIIGVGVGVGFPIFVVAKMNIILYRY